MPAPVGDHDTGAGAICEYGNLGMDSDMGTTRFRPILRECLGTLHREWKVALTPVPRPEKWVFIVGCYNSGTTLLAELMGRHPAISALPTEGYFITDGFVKDYEIGLPRMWVEREDLFRLTEVDQGPDPVRIKKEWGMRLDLSRPVLLEKSPPNGARTRWLQRHFERAHFIGIVRNGYAVAEGITRKGDPQHMRHGWPIEMSAYQWRRANEVLEDDRPHLNRFRWVRYEDLTEDPVGVLNEITGFLDIEGFPRAAADRAWSIHERRERIRNMNQESIDRLTPGQIRRINQVAGEMLRRFGYEVLSA